MEAKDSEVQPREELGLWYLGRAYAELDEAERYFSLFRYAESVMCAYESIEFSVKAMCKLLDIEYSKRHFLDAPTLVRLAQKVGEKWLDEKSKLLSDLPVILGYTDELRNICRYGIDEGGTPVISPKEIFKKDHCEKVLRDANQICDLLHRVDMERRWRGHKKFGILNGYVEEPEKEKRCTEYVLTADKADFWRNYFSNLRAEDGQKKYDVKEIMAREINDSYSVILNPFGETYPEYDLKGRQVYNIICNYIRNGGVFINTAGFPFFYAWIVSLGRKEPISEERLLLPRLIKIEGGTFSVEQLQTLIGFTGTLYYKDFGAVTTSDTSLHSGAIPLKPFQMDQDREMFGDLVSNINPDIHFSENVMATFNLLENMRKKNVRELVFASSSSVYGEPEEIPVGEDAPIKPVSVYGASKAACENLIHAYSRLYGIKAVVLRYANVVGPRLRHGVIHDLMVKLQRNPRELEVLGDGTQTRSYIYISDAIQATMTAYFESKANFDVYNVASEDWITVNDIVEVILNELRLNPNIRYKPIAHGIGWSGDVKKIALKINKLKALKFRPRMSSINSVKITVSDLMRELK